jgi:hypothetical protein
MIISVFLLYLTWIANRQAVYRASDFSSTPVQNMRVDHRGVYVSVP